MQESESFVFSYTKVLISNGVTGSPAESRIRFSNEKNIEVGCAKKSEIMGEHGDISTTLVLVAVADPHEEVGRIETGGSAMF